jgi:transcriptional regulator with XRE-family HTH domain
METLEAVIARNVATLRKKRGLGVRGLSNALTELGRPILPSGITKIESQDRRVSVGDLVALAIALDVSPVRILLPPERIDDDVQLTPTRAAPRMAAWRWATGEQPLLDRDEEVPWDDPRVREFIRISRPYENSPLREAREFLGKRIQGRFTATITEETANLNIHLSADGEIPPGIEISYEEPHGQR